MAQLTPEVRELVALRVTSVEQLDVLMLLFKEKGRSWTAAEVARDLGTAPESAGMRLFLLSSTGLLQAEGTPARYRFSDAAGPLAIFMEPLAAAYEEDRNAVIQQLFSTGSDPVKDFANAFRLKK